MRAKIRKITLLLTIIIFLISSLKYMHLTVNSKTTEDNNNFDISLYSSKINNDNYEEISLKLSYENKIYSFKSPVIIQNNRYFITVNDAADIVDGNLTLKNNFIKISLEDKKINIDTKNNYFIINNKNKDNLRTSILEIGLKKYISLYDFCKIFDLKTVWDHSENTITIFKSKTKSIKKNQENVGRVAFIRFEDVEAGSIYLNEECLEKFRVIGDYFNSESIPFHIAWVPRYVNPPKNIDNDLLKDNNIENADFLFTFDYLIDRGATIGLHGYTHQHGDEESVVGTEFSSTVNTNESVIKERVGKAIETANKLNIPISFFETPHYRGTEFQQSIFEQYFDIIYEPYIGMYNSIPLVSPRNKKTLYIPTPLSYVKGDNGIGEMLNNIDNNGINQIASLFVHPSKEFQYIKIVKGNDGYHNYIYDENSILHQITKELKERGYRIISVKDYR